MKRISVTQLSEFLTQIRDGTFIPAIEAEPFGPIDPGICASLIDKGRRLWKRSAWGIPHVISGKEEVLASYTRSRRLGIFARSYRIQPAFARRVLKLYEGPFEEQLLDEYRAGMTIVELACRHDTSRESISMWLRENGVAVKPGRRANDMPANEVREIFGELNSENKVAKHFGVSWSTARKRLKELGLK